MDAVGRSGGGLWLQGLRFALFGDTGRVPASWSVGSCCPLQGVVGTITRRLQGRVTELATSLSYSLRHNPVTLVNVVFEDQLVLGKVKPRGLRFLLPPS